MDGDGGGRRAVDTARRRDRLSHDLRDAGLPDADTRLLEEIEYALDLRPHEGVVPRFGAIVTGTDQHLSETGWGARVDFEDLRRLRQLADGRTSFVVRATEGGHLAVRDHLATEAALAALCARARVQVVRLLDDVRLQVVTEDRIFQLDRARWTSRPTSLACLWRVREADVALHVPLPVCHGLLDLAVHVLGGAGVGALLVWLPDRDRRGCSGTLPHGGAMPPLDVTDRRLHHGLSTLLGQQDGAALVGPDGQLWWTGAELAAPRHVEFEPTSGGMRHRSAARFSASRPEAMVVAVSDDGPVSVYVGGRDLTGPPAANRPGPPREANAGP